MNGLGHKLRTFTGQTEKVGILQGQIKAPLSTRTGASVYNPKLYSHGQKTCTTNLTGHIRKPARRRSTALARSMALSLLLCFTMQQARAQEAETPWPEAKSDSKMSWASSFVVLGTTMHDAKLILADRGLRPYKKPGNDSMIFLSDYFLFGKLCQRGYLFSDNILVQESLLIPMATWDLYMATRKVITDLKGDLPHIDIEDTDPILAARSWVSNGIWEGVALYTNYDILYIYKGSDE